MPLKGMDQQRASSDETAMAIDGGDTSSMSSLKDKFCSKLEEFLSSNLDNYRSTVMSDERYRELIAETKEAKEKKLRGETLTAKQHRRLRRFDVLSTTTEVDGKVCTTVERLILRDSIDSGDNVKYFCPAGELYDIIHSAHISSGHKGEKSMEAKVKQKYCNVTRVLIKMYLELCPLCHSKKDSRVTRVKKVTVTTPEGSPQSSELMEFIRCANTAELNYRCQVDVVDLQSYPDGDYRFVLNYRDLLTQFTVLRPLKTKNPDEVAHHLVDVFCLLGAPCVLLSDCGREFCSRVIHNLSTWSNMKVVHGKCQNECFNDDVRKSIIAYMKKERTTEWSDGLKFIQSSMNRSFDGNIRRSPYEAVFGMRQRNGLLDTRLAKNIVRELQTEEDLEDALTSQGMTVEHLLLPNDGDLLEGASREEVDTDIDREPLQSCGEDAGFCVLCARKRHIDVQRSACKRNLDLLLDRTSDSDGLQNKRSTECVYTRNDLTPVDSTVIQLPDIGLEQNDKAVDSTVPEALAEQHQLGFVIRCNCRIHCNNRKCSCRKNNVKCNAKCHGSADCINK